jgi:hypothetical protein
MLATRTTPVVITMVKVADVVVVIMVLTVMVAILTVVAHHTHAFIPV